MYINSIPSVNQIELITGEPLKSCTFYDAGGNIVSCPLLSCAFDGKNHHILMDASSLQRWTLERPVLYTVAFNGNSTSFGYCSLKTFQNKTVLFNDAPIYLRGYIRGIVAHDHPNMTGRSNYEAALKNIRQAKKYGFNLVRFHSTIPSEEFVRAADELGMLIHMEIGFTYEYDSQGNKQNLSMSNDNWVNTILRYRNHPSVAIFCIGNEMHNSGHYPEVHNLYRIAKELAPGKLILDNSGWGEYDRTTADIYCQHIAYFFPFKHHKDMFLEDTPWHFNGSVHDVPLKARNQTAHAEISFHRHAQPLRPTLAHEAMHYIDIPDYEALNAKFDAFAKQVGEEHLVQNGIKKPRYMTELPNLIARKGLQSRMRDYIVGSQSWKLMAMKVYMERMRLSPLCGYEMLQFSDCLKYENKNGIVDCFDDDKNIDPLWLRQINDDVVLLADFSDEAAYNDASIHAALYISDFLPDPEVVGDFRLYLEDELLYEGNRYVLAGGLQKLVEMDISVATAKDPQKHTLRAEFVSEALHIENQWSLWFYPRRTPMLRPHMLLDSDVLRSYYSQGTVTTNLIVTDRLDNTLLQALDSGKNAILFYEYGSERNQWQFPGAMERFKPCIWDRGSNLGGIIYSEELQKTLGSSRYFDLNLQPLLEAGSKVNLDAFPCAVTEWISGIDKPVRDRMKGMIQGIKDFIDADTLRKFCHLFALQVGAGKLLVCTFRVSNTASPVTNNLLYSLLTTPVLFESNCYISTASLRDWLEDCNKKGLREEDVMNHFWELDNKIVEDTLFWEEAGVNLAELKE